MLSRHLVRASALSRPALAAAASPSSSSATSTCLVLLAAQQLRRGYATPSGPPPPGFRLPPPTPWDREKEGTFTKAGKYFLLTEMARGMYLLLEQFFRPP